MHVKTRSLILALSAAMITGTLQASELFVYPAKGQSAEQQDKDKFECYNWAKNDSGFDPMAPPKATEPAPTTQTRSGGTRRGLVGGAALGAIVGDSSKAARRGAAAGGLIGGARQSSHNRQVEQERAQWEQQQAAQYSQSRNNYNRAYSACLEGRGYTVK